MAATYALPCLDVIEGDEVSFVHPDTDTLVSVRVTEAPFIHCPGTVIVPADGMQILVDHEALLWVTR